MTKALLKVPITRQRADLAQLPEERGGFRRAVAARGSGRPAGSLRRGRFGGGWGPGRLSLLTSERPEERQQVPLLLFAETQRPEHPGVVAPVVEDDDVLERGEGTIMHVGWRLLDVAQTHGAELAAVGRIMRDQLAAGIVRHRIPAGSLHA